MIVGPKRKKWQKKGIRMNFKNERGKIGDDKLAKINIVEKASNDTIIRRPINRW